MRLLTSALCLLALTGCAAMSSSGVITVDPKPFPHPGIYSGSVINGIVTYKIESDGRGLSCFRNKFSGDVFRGDLKYDGDKIHTEDGTVTVDSLSPDLLRVSAFMTNAEMHRIEQPPAVCKDFFSNQ